MLAAFKEAPEVLWESSAVQTVKIHARTASKLQTHSLQTALTWRAAYASEAGVSQKDGLTAQVYLVKRRVEAGMVTDRENTEANRDLKELWQAVSYKSGWQ
jgi:hypothetical protein